MQVRFEYDTPISEKDAKSIAYDIIRSEIGSIPHPGKPQIKDDVWIIPILAKYPKVISEQGIEIPNKVRFLNFDKVGEIVIDANTGNLVSRSKYYDVVNNIREKMNIIRTSVEMALVKVGADNFSKLAFPEHMHTPINDILSWILVHDTIDLKEDLDFFKNEGITKYLQNINILIEIGLLRRNEHIIVPDNNLILIESKYDTLPEKITYAMSYFFQEGYRYIDSIKQVLGPHLSITGLIYERAVQFQKILPFNYDSISDMFIGISSSEKRFKLPRYLIQLESVGLIKGDSSLGQYYWMGDEDIFNKICLEEEILTPALEMIRPEIY